MTINNLPSNYEFNNIGLTLHALNSGGTYQKDYNARHINITVSVDDEDVFTETDVNVNDLEHKKFWEKKAENAITVTDNSITLKITTTKGTTNTGMFLGLESITLSNITTTNVNYHLVYNSKTIDSVDGVEAQIGSAPALPASFGRDYCSYAYYSDADCTQEITTISDDTEDIYVNVTVNKNELPFEFSESYENAHWYCMNGQANNYYVLYTDGINAKNNATGKGDTYLWAFLGNPIEGVKVINKGVGEGLYMQSNPNTAAGGENVVFGEEEQTWILQKQTNVYAYGGTNTFLLYNGNIWFNADPSGNMKFYNGNNQGSTMWVYEPLEVSMNVSAETKWGTFIAPFDYTIPEGVTASTAAEVSGDYVQLNALEGTIPANTPVILYSEDGVTETQSGPNAGKSNTYISGLLTGVYTATTAPAGSYVLQNHNGTVAFYQVQDVTPTVDANHAYLTLPSATSEAKAAFFLGNNDVTGIEAAESAQTEPAAIYNLAGQRVQKATKGIYIVGGKKVVVK